VANCRKTVLQPVSLAYGLLLKAVRIHGEGALQLP